MAKCEHERRAEIRTQCFSGPVSIADQNPAAHGGVTVTVECSLCGARRRENINGCHEELGSWGPDRATRQRELDDARETVRRLRDDAIRATASMTRGGQTVTLRIDAEGYVIGDADPATMMSAARGWSGVDLATRLRAAIAEAAELAEDL